MLIGLFSDIHANLEAMTAVVERLTAEGIGRSLCLGDIVGYGANPNECIELVSRLGAEVVAGNHDYAAVGKTPLEDFMPNAAEAIAWTRSRLEPESTRFLETLGLEKTLPPFLLVHSAPSAPAAWHYISTFDDARREFVHFDAPACIVGHSHQPFVVSRTGSDLDQLPATRLILAEGVRYIINIGSVGQPRDGDPRACACLFDTGTREFRFLRIDYDIRAAQAKILLAGLPPYLANRLAQGI